MTGWWPRMCSETGYFHGNYYLVGWGGEGLGFPLPIRSRGGFSRD